jgi:hypothetical protein
MGERRVNAVKDKASKSDDQANAMPHSLPLHKVKRDRQDQAVTMNSHRVDNDESTTGLISDSCPPTESFALKI